MNKLSFTTLLIAAVIVNATDSAVIHVASLSLNGEQAAITETEIDTEDSIVGIKVGRLTATVHIDKAPIIGTSAFHKINCLKSKMYLFVTCPNGTTTGFNTYVTNVEDADFSTPEKVSSSYKTAGHPNFECETVKNVKYALKVNVVSQDQNYKSDDISATQELIVNLVIEEEKASAVHALI